jgi:hypothetical protein
MLEELSPIDFKKIIESEILPIKDATSRKFIKQAELILRKPPFRYSTRISNEVADGIVHYNDRLVSNAVLGYDYDDDYRDEGFEDGDVFDYQDYKLNELNGIGDKYNRIRDHIVLPIRFSNGNVSIHDKIQHDVEFFNFMTTVYGEKSFEDLLLDFGNNQPTCENVSDLLGLLGVIISFLDRNKDSAFVVTIGLIGEREGVQSFTEGIANIENSLIPLCNSEDSIFKIVNLCTFTKNNNMKMSTIAASNIKKFVVTKKP